MKQHMLTHKIRDMPQHMFGNQSNSSSDSYPPHQRQSESQSRHSPSPILNLKSDSQQDGNRIIRHSTPEREAPQHLTSPQIQPSPREAAPPPTKSPQQSTGISPVPTNVLMEQHVIKQEPGMKRSPSELIEQPLPKRPLSEFCFFFAYFLFC